MWHCVVIRTDAFSSQVSRTDAPKLQVTQLLVGCSCSGSSVLELWPDLAGVDIGNSYEFCETVVILGLNATMPLSSCVLRALGTPSMADLRYLENTIPGPQSGTLWAIWEIDRYTKEKRRIPKMTKI